VTTEHVEAPELDGWGTVTFGMTETEARAAYPAAVAINPPEDYDRAAAFAKLRLPVVQAAGLDFSALFLFSKTTQRLSMIILRRQPETPSEYERVLAALTDKYGSPSRSKALQTASVDTSSPEQAAKTRIGSGSAAWIGGKTTVNLSYFEAMGTRHLLVSYEPKSHEANL
jgi:hypothetical protein